MRAYKSYICIALSLIVVLLCLSVGIEVYAGLKIKSESNSVTNKIDSFNQNISGVNKNLQSINSQLQTENSTLSGRISQP